MNLDTVRGWSSTASRIVRAGTNEERAELTASTLAKLEVMAARAQAAGDIEHVELESHGWRVVEWYKAGFLKGGMGNLGDGGQQHRERLWLSPHCLGATASPQLGLFA